MKLIYRLVIGTLVSFLVAGAGEVGLLARAQNVQKASITGTVMATTGRFLRGARISLIRDDMVLSLVATDNAGRYSFTGLDPGEYRLTAGSDGFIHQEYGQRKQGARG